jgi:hypothetical protein
MRRYRREKERERERENVDLLADLVIHTENNISLRLLPSAKLE